MTEPVMGLTFEKVWAALMETRENIERLSKERIEAECRLQKVLEEQSKEIKQTLQELADQSKETKAQMAETEKQMAETDKRIAETEKQMAETDKRIAKTEKLVARMTKNLGGLSRSLGELIETLIAARLWEKFGNYPYNLRRAYRRVPIYDNNSRCLTDVDILLADTDIVMAVEVKREPAINDVEHHIKRMDLIRKFPPAETLGKRLIGAIAGGTVDPDVHNYAYKAGFFVLELTGASVRLIDPPEGFQPQEW